MKRLLALVLMVLPVAAVTGCPIYPDECDSRSDCAIGYACDRAIGECVLIEDERPAPNVPTRCSDDGDCRTGQICDEFQRCVSEPAAGGSAGQSSGGSAGESQAGAAGESTGAGMNAGGAAGSD